MAKSHLGDPHNHHQPQQRSPKTDLSRVGPLTIPGDPWSLSRQKNQILAKMLGTNPDKNGPKYPKGQIDYPDRKNGKCYSMSTNPDKYWHGAGASAASLLIFFNC